MGLTLAFDTATADTAVAVCEGDEVVAEQVLGPEEEGGRPQHGIALLGLVEELVGRAGGWPRVDRLAVGVGPGSFTGIRIGVATARGLAQARELPLTGVISTAALAAGIDADAARSRIAVIDARRGELFVAVRAPGAKLASDPFLLAPESAAQAFQGAAEPIAAGDGAIRFRSELESAGVEVPPDGNAAHRLSARFVSALAPDFGEGRPEDIKPLYLRRPDAERWHERDRGDG